MRAKKSFIENVFFLAMVGILAGALGGLAIGLVTGKSTTPATAGGK